MLHKRRLHHKLVVLRRIKVWQLVILLVVFGGVSAYLLRQNNLGMVERRNIVKQTDEQNGNVQAALVELQNFVGTHMNTELGKGIFLEHSYQRAYDAALQKAANQVNPNSAAYTQVEQACHHEYAKHAVFQRYIQCIQERLKAVSPGADPLAQVKAPAAELFTYTFASPVWSLDWAGISVLITLMLGVLIMLRIAGYIMLRMLLRAHKQ